MLTTEEIIDINKRLMNSVKMKKELTSQLQFCCSMTVLYAAVALYCLVNREWVVFSIILGTIGYQARTIYLIWEARKQLGESMDSLQSLDERVKIQS